MALILASTYEGQILYFTKIKSWKLSGEEESLHNAGSYLEIQIQGL